MTTEYVMVPREATAQELRGVLGVALELLNECAGPMEVAAAVLESEVADDGLERLIERVKKFYADASLLQAAPPAPAMHASAPTGLKCADCHMDKEACPTCYEAWWKARHPNSHQMPDVAPPAPVAVQPAPVADWEPLPEDADERRMFDKGTQLCGDVRINIASMLRIFAEARAGGSYADQCRIMANEVAKLYASPSPAPVADLVVTDAQIEEIAARMGARAPAALHWKEFARAILAAQSGAGARGDGQ